MGMDTCAKLMGLRLLTPLDFLLLSACTWRIARLLSKEAGPYNILALLRERFSLGGLWDCLYCTSLWVAIVVWLIYQTPAYMLVHIGAISGGAMLLHRYTGGDHL